MILIVFCILIILLIFLKKEIELFVTNPCEDYLNNKDYLVHMIPHHQVAIDMSKRLLLYTNHSYLIDFCKKLIIDQQGEIYRMNHLLNNTYNYQSELLEINGKDQNTLFTPHR